MVTAKARHLEETKYQRGNVFKRFIWNQREDMGALVDITKHGIVLIAWVTFSCVDWIEEHNGINHHFSTYLLNCDLLTQKIGLRTGPICAKLVLRSRTFAFLISGLKSEITADSERVTFGCCHLSPNTWRPTGLFNGQSVGTRLPD